MSIKNKRALEFSFTWLFAVIIGAAILVLAVYAATKVIGSGQAETSTAAAKEIGVLLNPLETSFEEASSTSLALPVDTRIYNRCNSVEGSGFGGQIIQTSQKSFGKWSDLSTEIEFQNKYIFSDEYEEGKVFHIFSKPFDFPFKVADAIYLTSSNKKYCFIDSRDLPDDIKNELSDLKQGNLIIAKDCPDNAIRVCFGSETGCNVKVRYGQGYVERNGERVYFETDTLMYAAIFSNNKNYECHVKRLMARAEELSKLYESKAISLSQKGCDSNIDIGTFGIILENYENSMDLRTIFPKANEMGEQNRNTQCKLW
ncbi:MAG: hypothetical protein WD876_02105 [Candidatus Pacearchaeota archaeon]